MIDNSKWISAFVSLQNARNVVLLETLPTKV